MTDNNSHQNNYQEIMRLYDYAESLIETVDSNQSPDPSVQLEVVEPLIEEIEKTTDIISAEYREFALKNKKIDILTKKKVENALRTLYLAIIRCKDQAITQSAKKSKTDAPAFSFSLLSKIVDGLSKHLDKLLSLLSHAMKTSFKDHHYGRSGRQSGNMIGKSQSSPNRSNPTNSTPPNN